LNSTDAKKPAGWVSLCEAHYLFSTPLCSRGFDISYPPYLRKGAKGNLPTPGNHRVGDCRFIFWLLGY